MVSANTKRKIEKVTFDLCDNLTDKADKYYISFRILNRCGFYFQAINCLLFSLESFFKLLYLLERKEYTEEELKEFMHDLKILTKEISLDKDKFQIIHQIIEEYRYTDIRYKDGLLINKLNYRKNGKWPCLDTLSTEILELDKIIREKIREKFNCQGYDSSLLYINKNIQPQQIKEFIEDSLSKGDENFISVDYT